VSAAGEYRRDIDGLRALAILPVLLYHAHVPFVTGGYVGVDVFFVISGFLITRIIAREVDEGRFSIVRFYERRARRIMPALLPMIAAVLAAAAWLYLPGDFEGVPGSALAATLFVSNLSFFLQTGYFQIGAEAMPLLHTWSLAIEEQFYIFFPLLLILVARVAPRWRVWIVGGIALASFALAVWFQSNWASFSFFLLPPRAWELFAGALLALGAVPQVRPQRAREAIAAAGLIALLAAVFLFTRATVFPGVNALVPVLGAAALIHSAPGTLTGRLLGTKPLVWVGLISYSLYLWHWPLIVFTEYAMEAKLDGAVRIAVLAASFAAAWASWRYIEAPFRDAKRFGQRRIFTFTGAGMATVCAAGAAMLLAGGWPQRFAPEVGKLADAKYDSSPDRERCHDLKPGKPACVLGAKGVAPTTLLWGDSHGVEFSYVLSQKLASEGQSMIERTHSSCPPVLGYQAPTDAECKGINDDVMAAIRANPALRTIYLSAFWESPAYADTRTMVELDETIATLIADGRQVVLIGPVPPNRFDVPRHLARLAAEGRLAEATGRARADIAPVEHRIGEVAARWEPKGLRYINPIDTLCDAQNCAIVRGGVPLYYDYHHPSVAGASLILGGPEQVASRSH
jgi:peptidoglycan/LPS O-acetylase OafA/YrhL